MLQRMRDNLQGWAAKVIVALIVLTMAMFGFGAFNFFSSGEPVVASVNGEDITQSRLAGEVERQRQRIAAQMGNVDPDSLDSALLQRSVLEGLINRVLLLATTEDLGLAVSETEVDRAIVSNPDFMTDESFDPVRFRTLLSGAGHTPVSFKRELADSYRIVQLNEAVGETPFVIDDEVRNMARLLAQTRDFAYLSFDPTTIAATVTVDESEVTDFYEARPDEFMTEAAVDLEYVELTVGALASDPSIEVSDDEIRSRYEADRAAFAANEQRHAAHILLEVNDKRSESDAVAEIRALKQRVLAGESFEELARASSEDPGSAATGGDLGFVSRGAFVPEFDDAVWSMNPGDISDPIITQFGVHLIKLIEVRAETYPTLEQKREEVVASLRRSKAEELYLDRVRQLDELVFDAPEELQTAASALGLDVKTLSDLKRSSASGPFADERLLNAAFSEDVVTKKFNSRVVDFGDRAISVRMTGYRPAERRSLTDVSEEIRTSLAIEKASVVARERAGKALERVLAGDGTATIAADLGTNWEVREGVRRATQDIDMAIVNAVFELPRPDIDHRVAQMLDTATGQVAVVMLTAVNDGDYGALTDADRETLSSQVERLIGGMEFNALFESVRAEASIVRR